MKTSDYPNYLVPLYIAKKLKEIGFRKKTCFYYSFEDYALYVVSMPEDYNKKCYEEKYVTIPIWGQVFEWFRNKGFCITLENHKENTRFMFYNMKIDKGKHFKGDFPSYEKAIKELVNKLIEIYKNKLK